MTFRANVSAEMSLVPYDSSDSETEIEPPKNSGQPKKILLSPISKYNAEDLDTKPRQSGSMQDKADLLEILPPPRHVPLSSPIFKQKILERGGKEVRRRISCRDEEECLHDMFGIKALTDPGQSSRPEVEQVNATCRKKNHISYLVQKAKENDQEMKNRWADSKFTRQQMKAKYGF